MQDIRKVFEDRDTDNSGSIDISEMSAAMKALQVNLSADEVKSLFKVSLEPVSRLRDVSYLPLPACCSFRTELLCKWIKAL